MTKVSVLLATIGLLSLSACEVKPADEVEGDSSSGPAVSSVTRNDVSQDAAPRAVAPRQEAMQVQPGPDGTTVELLSMKVNGDILTASLRCSSDKSFSIENFRIEQISLIDDATSQRIGVLRDGEGNAMVSNFDKGTQPKFDNLKVDCSSDSGVLWARFPAPPPSSQTVSLSLPNVGPFDAVPIQR